MTDDSFGKASNVHKLFDFVLDGIEFDCRLTGEGVEKLAAGATTTVAGLVTTRNRFIVPSEMASNCFR